MVRLFVILALALGFTVSPVEFKFGFVPKPARAQEMLRIAAVVNDEIVSVYDVLQRTDFQIIIGLGQRVTEEARAHLFPLMLRQMIDEKLMMQEVRRYGIQVPDEEVTAYLGAIEDANNRPKGSLVKEVGSVGLSPEVLLEQIRARLGWEILNRQRVRLTRPVSDEEIDRALALAKAAEGQQEYRVADLFIAFDAVGGDQAAKRLVTEIVHQLKNGVRFPVLAQQYSNSASAAAGGDLGWIRAGQIDPLLFSVLEKLQPGQIGAPVESVSGVHLLLLHEKRSAAGDLTRGEARLHLLSDRIEAESRRSLRNIRQAAVIDIRL